jgi:hypothetical protein
MPTKTQKYIVIGVCILFASLLLIDRYFWAQISQWREDQSTNIWLGFTRGIHNIPVGLISSRKIPNPNGMPLLGAFLSLFPNLLTVSLFLGISQIVLILLVGWKAFKGNWDYFLLATLPPLASIPLRSTSVEFWNQYTITLLNLFFLFWAVRYLDSASVWNLPPIVLLILFAPSLYLAGIVNAIVMTILTIGLMVYRQPNWSNVWAISMIIFSLVALSFFITWLPYFHSVSLKQILAFNEKADPSVFVPLTFAHADTRILSPPTQFLLNLVDRMYGLQVIFACVVFFSTFLTALFRERSTKYLGWNGNPSITRLVTLSGLFITLSYIVSILLGGPNWLGGERSDQTIQFLPTLLFLIFLLPFSMVKSEGAKRIIGRLSTLLAAAFVTVNLLCGFLILRDHLQYRGNVLTEADVPLVNKMHMVDFIANDWKNHSTSKVIPVDYALGGGKWDWVPEFGEKLTKWYPAVMTQGRSFDYELLRRYGLTNQQEGTQLRTFGNGRYLVTYAFEDPPIVSEGQITHYIFGRLRVSVVER